MKAPRKSFAVAIAVLLLASLCLLAGCSGGGGGAGGEVCEHQWNAATCSLPKTCELCHATEGSALGHTPSADDGDCTTAVSCSVCNEICIAARAAHTGGEATCESLARCAVCNKEYGELLLHTWNADEATEESDKHCTVCGYVAAQRLPHTHGGKLTHVEATAPDCDTAGNAEHWRCACGMLFSDSEGTREITDPDSVILAATGHSHADAWSANAQKHWHACACGDKKDAAAHTWNADGATEESDKHCTVCGYVVEEMIGHTHRFESALSWDDEGHWYAPTCGHTDVKGDYAVHTYESTVTAPTCTEQGYTTYTCACGRSYRDDYTSAAGHGFAQTLTYDGGGHWYASTCEHGATKDYAAHEYVRTVTAPTCTENGYTTYACACGYSYVGDETASHGHTVELWNEGSSALYDADTCKHAVTYTGACAVCGAPQQKTEYVEKHAWTYPVKEGFAANCQSDGKKLQLCKNEDCRYHSVAKDEIPYSAPDEHLWVLDDEQTIDGMTSYHCENGVCTAKKNVVSTSGTSASVPSTSVGALDEVSLGNAQIGFDEGIKNALGESGSDVEISAGTLEGSERESAIENAALTPEQKALLGEKEIYDFTLSTTENVSDLGGTATIRIPYTLSGEDPDNIIVWYISQGELTAVPATWADGYVTFTTTHFSYYVATTISPSQLCEYLKAHDLTNVHTVLPTCTTSGYTVCLRCGKQVEDSRTAPLGHDWHATVISERDCTTSGVTKYECARCDVAYQTLAGATGHYYAVKDQSNATCARSGYVTCGCIYCDSEYTLTLPQLDHNYLTRVVDPTCEARGYTQKTCLSCGDALYTSYVDARGHQYGTTLHTSPEGHFHACTACGKRGEIEAHLPGAAATEQSAQICTVCEYVIVPQLSHKHTLSRVEASAATCLESGNIAYYVCACGKWFLDGKGEQLISDHSAVIVEAKGHTHKSLPYVEPTCEKAGYTAGIVCTVCQSVLRGHVELPAYGHDYITTEVAPTCTAEGKISHVCAACGDRLADETVPRLEHKYEIGGIAAPSCTEKGFTTFVCIYCKDSYTGDPKDAYGHSYSTVWSTDASGHWHECTRCKERADAEAHTPGAEATEQSAQLCTVCGYVIEPIKNHVHLPQRVVEATEPDCDSVGNLAYSICACGEWFYDEGCEKPIASREDVILPPLGHALTLVPEQAPTCTEGGISAGHYCSRCEAYVGGHKPIAPLGHSPKALAGKAPTCEAEGLSDGEQCTRCGVVTLPQIPIAPLGHSPKALSGKAPTCEAEGLSDGEQCARCGAVTLPQIPIAPLGHSYVDGSCEHCGAKDPDDVTPDLPDDPDDPNDPNEPDEPDTTPNAIELLRTENGDGTLTVRVALKNAELAGVRFFLYYGDAIFLDASCTESAQYYDDGECVRYVFSRGENLQGKAQELLTVTLVSRDGSSPALALEIIEIYRFADDGSLEVPEYTVIDR